MRFFAPITDAARRVATLFEKWIFLIERGLPDGKKSPQKFDPIRAFCRGFPFGIRRFKPILPFLGGRSDAACRVVIKIVGLMGGGAGGMGWAW